MRVGISNPVSAIVPHAGKMSLLSRVIEGDEESIVVEADIHADTPLCFGGGVGGWVGIEYMAQAIAAWAGWQASLKGEPPRIGLLLGSRRYECSRPLFVVGDTLRIEARQVLWSENGLAQFDCRIQIDEEEVATAALTVFEPRDSDDFLKGKNE